MKVLGEDPFYKSRSLSEKNFVGSVEHLKMVDGVLFDERMMGIVSCSYKKSGSCIIQMQPESLIQMHSLAVLD